MTTPTLFSPLRIRDITFRNRLWVAPMCQYSVEAKDGTPTDWHLVHLGALARGGTGLVMTEATGVTPEGRISPWDTGWWNDEQTEAWRRIVDFIHTQGSTAGIQLAHAGRKASTFRDWSGRGVVPPEQGGWQPVAPSALAFHGLAEPTALSHTDIAQVVSAFADAARRAVDAGFDVVEVHAAHGYLLHEFLSPLSNVRTDEYGGDLAGRSRVVLEVIRAVREAVGPERAVLVRISATDWKEPEGWTADQSVEFARMAKAEGADMIDVSTGGNVADAAIPVAPGYQVPFAARIREEADIATCAVGLVTEPHLAASIVHSGQADAVMAGREFLRDPHFALRAAHELGVDVDYWPPAYARGTFSSRPH